jgi:hypothetical protein
MDIKDELKNCVRGYLGESASSFFLNRALGKIDEVETDRRSLADACGRVVKMIQLFIDEEMAEEVMKNLRTKIEQAGLP